MICGMNDFTTSLFRFSETPQPFQRIFFVKEDPDIQPKVTRDVLEKLINCLLPACDDHNGCSGGACFPVSISGQPSWEKVPIRQGNDRSRFPDIAKNIILMLYSLFPGIGNEFFSQFAIEFTLCMHADQTPLMV
jgi:hypothetical protein